MFAVSPVSSTSSSEIRAGPGPERRDGALAQADQPGPECVVPVGAGYVAAGHQRAHQPVDGGQRQTGLRGQFAQPDLAARVGHRLEQVEGPLQRLHAAAGCGLGTPIGRRQRSSAPARRPAPRRRRPRRRGGSPRCRTPARRSRRRRAGLARRSRATAALAAHIVSGACASSVSTTPASASSNASSSHSSATKPAACASSAVSSRARSSRSSARAGPSWATSIE